MYVSYYTVYYFSCPKLPHKSLKLNNVALAIHVGHLTVPVHIHSTVICNYAIIITFVFGH